MQNGPEILCTVDHVTAQFDIGFCGFLCTKRMLTGTSINKLHICRRTSIFLKLNAPTYYASILEGQMSVQKNSKRLLK